LRPQCPKEGSLWGQIAGVAWAVYGARAYFDAKRLAASVKELARHPLIGWDEAVGRFGAADWFERTAPADAFVYRTASLVNQLLAAKAGIGLAALPCYLGDPEPELIRALPNPLAELTAELWIVTHADLKNTARVRAFFDVVVGRLANQRDLFEGLYPDKNQPVSARTPIDRSNPNLSSVDGRNALGRIGRASESRFSREILARLPWRPWRAVRLAATRQVRHCPRPGGWTTAGRRLSI
jgi:LysR substrate binding domain